MRKVFILILFVLSLGFTKTKDDYLSEVNSAYQKYEVEYEYETSNYELLVIRGICNNKNTYGIYFYSSDSGKYQLKLQGTKEYTLKTNSRGDIYVLALLNSNEDMYVDIYMGENKQSLPFDLVLKPFEASDLTNPIEGENKGTAITRLSSFSLDSLSIYMIVCGGVILISSLVVFVFYKKKQGMFNKEVRQEGVFNFKEFLNQNIEEDYKEEVDVSNIIDLEEDDVKVVKEETQEEPKSVYNKVKDDFFYSDEASGFNIKTYLSDKGFITDYSSITDDEKNQIMLELMKLKNERKITNDEYLEEVYSLWKK